MRSILTIAIVGVAVWAGLAMDSATVNLIISNLFWILVVGVMSIIILYLIRRITTPVDHTTTIYNINHNSYDYSQHTTNQTAYIGSDTANRIGANNGGFLTSGDYQNG